LFHADPFGVIGDVGRGVLGGGVVPAAGSVKADGFPLGLVLFVGWIARGGLQDVGDALCSAALPEVEIAMGAGEDLVAARGDVGGGEPVHLHLAMVGEGGCAGQVHRPGGAVNAALRIPLGEQVELAVARVDKHGFAVVGAIGIADVVGLDGDVERGGSVDVQGRFGEAVDGVVRTHLAVVAEVADKDMRNASRGIHADGDFLDVPAAGIGAVRLGQAQDCDQTAITMHGIDERATSGVVVGVEHIRILVARNHARRLVDRGVKGADDYSILIVLRLTDREEC